MPNVTKDQSNHAIKAAVITGFCTLLVGAVTVYATYHHFNGENPHDPGSFAGMYEWQWAGDGWLGYLKVEKNGYAHIEMKKSMACGEATKMVTYLQQEGDAKAEVNKEGTEMEVSVPVRFAIIDSACNITGLKNLVTLRGTLSRKVAFAGPIEYQTKETAPIGDMVLVKDFTSGQH